MGCLAVFGLLTSGYDNPEQVSSIDSANLASRQVNESLSAGWGSGHTALSVCSEIYSIYWPCDLRVAISLRKTNAKDSICITHLECFYTDAHPLCRKIEKLVSLIPRELVEISAGSPSGLAFSATDHGMKWSSWS